MARLTRDRPLETFAPKNQPKRSRANVWFVKSDQGNLIERSQERLAIDFLLGSLEWTIAKNQGKMRAIYPLSSFP